MSEDLAGAERSGIDGPGLPETIRRLVAAYRPERIYLFGSRARGDAGPDSDYDLLVVGEVSGAGRRAARAFVQLFLTNVWEPFDATGRPGAQWARVREATERLRPLGSTVLMAAFRQRMDEEVREALGEEVERRAAGTERSA